MLINSIKPWHLNSGELTDEQVYLNRRAFMAAGGAALALGAAGLPALAREAIPTAGLYPKAQRNMAYRLKRPLTPEAISGKYNNFYEFGGTKQIARAAQALRVRPWAVKIDGEVEKPFEIDIDTLVRRMTVEERHYRHRCVEAWSMTVPWIGFPLKRLVELAKPLSSAQYVRFETFNDPKMAPGQRPAFFGLWRVDWPYVEAVTMAEAMNELAFMVTGAYGKPLAKQFGAPLRLALPWKYGFKSIKSIVRISFVTKRPVSFWQRELPGEYGFWANVNPDVPHPRWSQKTERVLGPGNKRIATVIYNGYGEQVAELYKGLKNEPLFK
jgi:sulfoxide reductase catalytic subunit YedY